MGAAAQAAVPGLYAWGVTVAPSMWATGSPRLARFSASVALLTLGAGVLLERRWGDRARIACMWAFIVACAVTWSSAPRSLGAFRHDAPAGAAGTLAWALFAFASCAPPAPAQATSTTKPPRRERLAGSDMAYVACGALLAGLLEVFGWRIAATERALLVRFVALAAGLAIIATSAEIALMRRTPRTMPPPGGRLRRATVALVALGLLVVSGLLAVALD
jgi:hypothetical protein